MRQTYIRDESITIQELINQNVAAIGENVIVRRFARYALGETSTAKKRRYQEPTARLAFFSLRSG